MDYDITINKWFKECPECGGKMFYTYKSDCNASINEHLRCKGCAHTGVKFTDERKHNISKGRTGKCCGKDNPNFGGLSESHIRNMSKALTGRTLSKTHRLLLSQKKIGNKNNLGKKHTEAVKEYLRITSRKNALKRYLATGLPTCVDNGAREYFQYQNEQGYTFEENYVLSDIGCVVDGYDPYQHIIVEYDTPYHKQSRQKVKDIKRQQLIIDYFNNIGKPLNGFYRVDSVTKEVCN